MCAKVVVRAEEVEVTIFFFEGGDGVLGAVIGGDSEGFKCLLLGLARWRRG